MEENINVFLSEIKDIISRLKIIGNKTGAREQFFKINEDVPDDGICALYDIPKKKLRIYCIRYGTLILILGSGGPKNVKKLQENDKLKNENYYLRKLSALITKKLKDGEIWYSNDKMDFEGNLGLNTEDYEVSTPSPTTSKKTHHKHGKCSLSYQECAELIPFLLKTH